jgi:hypothetical protein
MINKTKGIKITENIAKKVLNCEFLLFNVFFSSEATESI